MKLIFVRHGQDDDAYRGGWSSLGLLDEGKRQSRAVADYFHTTSEYKIENIVSSDLNRTLETAGYIAAALDIPIHTDTRLRETNNGDLAGMLNSEALVKYPGLFWNTLAMDEAYPNGESPVAFYRRIKDWFDSIIKKPLNNNGNLLVVTHSGVINIIYYLVKGLEWTNKKPQFPIDKCSIHVLNADSMTFEVENKVVWK